MSLPRSNTISLNIEYSAGAGEEPKGSLVPMYAILSIIEICFSAIDGVTCILLYAASRSVFTW